MKELWNRIVAILGSLKSDKLLHFIAGVTITALFAIVKSVAPYALFFGIFAGILKEWWDNGNEGSVEYWDIVATSLGAFAMQAFVWLYLSIW